MGQYHTTYAVRGVLISQGGHRFTNSVGGRDFYDDGVLDWNHLPIWVQERYKFLTARLEAVFSGDGFNMGADGPRVCGPCNERERLRDRVRELEEGLRPFAEFTQRFAVDSRDFDRARAVLEKGK